MIDELAAADNEDLKKRKRQSMLNNAVGSLAIEGQCLDPEAKALTERYVKGELDSNQLEAALMAKYITMNKPNEISDFIP